MLSRAMHSMRQADADTIYSMILILRRGEGLVRWFYMHKKGALDVYWALPLCSTPNFVSPSSTEDYPRARLLSQGPTGSGPFPVAH